MEPWLALGALSDHPSTVHHAGTVFPLPIPPLGAALCCGSVASRG